MNGMNHHRMRMAVIAVALLASTLVFAQQPVIRVNPQLIDFEEVAVGEASVESYRIGARGVEGRIIIGSANPFFTVSLTERGRFMRRLVIEPEDGVIDQAIFVKFAPRMAGAVRGEIIHLSREIEGRIAVTVVGTGVRDENEIPFIMEPRRLDMGEVTIGEQAIESYTIRGTDIRGRLMLASNNPQITMSLRENGEYGHRLELNPDNGAIRQQIFVRFAPRMAGPVRGAIMHHLMFANVPVQLPVFGIGIPAEEEEDDRPIILEPRQIAFGEVIIGESATEVYRIAAADLPGRMIIVSENPQVTLSLRENGEYTNRLELNPDNGAIRQAVYVRFTPRVAGPLRGGIAHHLNNTVRPVILPVAGMGVPANQQLPIVIDPRQIDFDSVAIGRQAIESYSLFAENARGRMVVRAGNPQIALSLRENGEYADHLMIDPVDGVIRHTVYVRYTPRMPGQLRAAVFHHFLNTNVQVPLVVTGIGYFAADRNEGLSAEEDALLVSKTALLGNYPNPFNPETTIRFSLEDNAPVNLAVYNLQGQKISTLVNSNLPGGEHNVVWRGNNESGEEMPSGVYFYLLETGGITHKGRMVLMK